MMLCTIKSIEAKIENIKEIVDFSWELACCNAKCGFKYRV